MLERVRIIGNYFTNVLIDGPILEAKVTQLLIFLKVMNNGRWFGWIQKFKWGGDLWDFFLENQGKLKKISVKWGY